MKVKVKLRALAEVWAETVIDVPDGDKPLDRRVDEAVAELDGAVVQSLDWQECDSPAMDSDDIDDIEIVEEQ